MRILALIDDPHVVRRILEHLGRWAPAATEKRRDRQGAPENAESIFLSVCGHGRLQMALKANAEMRRVATPTTRCRL